MNESDKERDSHNPHGSELEEHLKGEFCVSVKRE